MPLPRFPCPACGREIAVTQLARPKLYRHDPPRREPGDVLKSCRGSLKPAHPKGVGSWPVLFAYETPTLDDGQADGHPVGEQSGLF